MAWLAKMELVHVLQYCLTLTSIQDTCTLYFVINQSDKNHVDIWIWWGLRIGWIINGSDHRDRFSYMCIQLKWLGYANSEDSEDLHVVFNATLYTFLYLIPTSEQINWSTNAGIYIRWFSLYAIDLIQC